MQDILRIMAAIENETSTMFHEYDVSLWNDYISICEMPEGTDKRRKKMFLHSKLCKILDNLRMD